MDNHNYQQDNQNYSFWLCVASAVGAVIHWFAEHVTASHVSTFFTCSAATVAMVAGWYNIKLSKRKLKNGDNE